MNFAAQWGKGKNRDEDEQEKDRRRERERQEKREDRRPILEKLGAAFLRSFRGQHGEKMVCTRGVLWVTGTSGSPTAISTQTKRGRRPHHHVEAAVDCGTNLAFIKTTLFYRSK